jgi:hypothetical protein
MTQKLKILHQSNVLVERDLVVAFQHEFTAEVKASVGLGRKPHPGRGESDAVLFSALQRPLQDCSSADVVREATYSALSPSQLQECGNPALAMSLSERLPQNVKAF